MIAQLVKSSEPSIDIKLMNVSKQCESVDCGLHVIAIITLLALATDPTTIVFCQNEMGTHLITIFETKKISTFPVQKKRKPVNSVSKIVQYKLYCACRPPNDSDKCGEWFH